MNYANMLDDGKLKKGFIIATLVSTVIGTLTTSMNLHDKLQEKRKTEQQKQLDEKQSKHINNLQEAVDRLHDQEQGGSDNGSDKTSKSRRKRSKSVNNGNGRDRSRRRKSIAGNERDGDSDDYDRQAEKSRMMIERQYEDNLRRMGPRYAQGDVIAENQLQGQVIALQQTVINVLQDALMNGRSLTKADVHRLVMAQQTARQGSLDALRDQYDRMLDGPKQNFAVEDVRRRDYQGPQRQLTLPAPEPDDSFAPPRRVQTQPISYDNHPTDLYCRYAEALQADSRRPLHSAFTVNGSQNCPACGVRITVSNQDFWVFETRTNVGREDDDNLVEVMPFTMDARLVVKSHTPSGELACYLCYKERDVDAFCPSVEALIKHLGSFHTRDEFEREVDLWVERR